MQPPTDQIQIPLEQLMGQDPNVVMLDQLARIVIMNGLETLVQAIIFGVVLYIVLRLNDRH